MTPSEISDQAKNAMFTPNELDLLNITCQTSIDAIYMEPPMFIRRNIGKMSVFN